MVNFMNKTNEVVQFFQYTVSPPSHCLLTRNWIPSFVFSVRTIVFKKNGPPTNYKFQIHNIAHARLLEAPVHKMTK